MRTVNSLGKRIMAMLLCVVMTLSLLPNAAFAVEELSSDTTPINSASAEDDMSGQTGELPEDTAAPVVSLYKNDGTELAEGSYSAEALSDCYVQVVDENFQEKAYLVYGEGVNISGFGVEDTKYTLGDAEGDWIKAESAENTWQCKLDFTSNANYTVKVKADGKKVFERTFAVDKSAPEVTVKYQNIFQTIANTLFFKKTVQVTVTARERTTEVTAFGLELLDDKENPAANNGFTLPEDLVIKLADDGAYTLSGEKGCVTIQEAKLSASDNNWKTYTLIAEVPAQFRGLVKTTAVNAAGGTGEGKDEKLVVADDVSPLVEISYVGTSANKVTDTDDGIKNVKVADENTRFVYSDAVTAVIKVKEANFYPENLLVTVLHNNAQTALYDGNGWTEDSDGSHINEISLQDDGDYQIIVDYVDNSGNAMKWTSGEYEGKAGEKAYTSNIHTVDTVAPLVSVHKSDGTEIIESSYYTEELKDCYIQVTDVNFRPDKTKVTIVGSNIHGNPVVKIAAGEWSKEDNNIWRTDAISFVDNANYKVSVNAVDAAGKAHAFERGFALDKSAPQAVSVEYENEGNGFYKENVPVTITVKEVTTEVTAFSLELVKDDKNAAATDVDLPKDLVISKGNDGEWTTSGDAGCLKDSIAVSTSNEEVVSCRYYVLTATIPAQFKGKVRAYATNEAGLTSAELTSSVATVDSKAPEMKVTYSGADAETEVTKASDTEDGIVLVDAADKDTRFIYSGDAVATLAVTEANFFEEDVTVSVTKDGQPVEIKPIVWTEGQEPAQQIGIIPLSGDGDYQLTVNYIDHSGNAMKWTSGEYEGKAGEKAYTSNIHTIDTAAPELKVAYSGKAVDTVVNKIKDTEAGIEIVDTANGDTRFIYSGDVVATMEVAEANFNKDEVEVTVWKDGAASTDYEMTGWQKNTESGKWFSTITLSGDGDYQVCVRYADSSNNPMNWDSAEFQGKMGEAEYKSNVHTIDTVAPKVTLHKDGKDGPVVQDLKYDQKFVGYIQVVDKNFRKESTEVTVSAKNITGKTVVDAVETGQWEKVDPAGDTWQCEVEFQKNANYAVTVKAVDATEGNSSLIQQFTIDDKAPDVTVRYKEDGQIIVDNRHFYNESVEVEIVARESTTEVVSFGLELNAHENSAATDVKLPENLEIGVDGAVSGEKNCVDVIGVSVIEKSNAKEYILTAKIPAQFKGKVKAYATNAAGLSAEGVETNTATVDSKAPKLEITYATNGKTRKVKDDAETGIKIVDTANGGTRFVYSDTVVATLTVEEANFFSDNVEITVKRNGKAIKAYGTTDWTQDGQSGKWIKTISLSRDGDYQIIVDYTDNSGNEMNWKSDEFEDKKSDEDPTTTNTYTSNIHTVDTEAPVLRWEFKENGGNKSAHQADGYYSVTRTAKVTVKDRNFRASDVESEFSATDVNGKPVNDVKVELNWVGTDEDKDGIKETWTAEVDFNADANYSWKLCAEDLFDRASNALGKKFTVDRSAPELAINYDKSVIKTALGEIFFWNDSVTVTLSASEKTTKIDYFKIDVIADSNYAAATNLILPNELIVDSTGNRVKGAAGFLEGKIKAEPVKKDEDAGTQTTKLSFDIPAQFRGNVTFSACNWTGVEAKPEGDGTVVVDSISPEMQITYEGVRKNSVEDKCDGELKNGVDFPANDSETTRFIYNSPITATIDLVEANFDAQDITVTVTHDGKAQKVNDWTVDNEKGKHQLVIEMREDGDYQIKVKYTDHSDNKMNWKSDEFEDKKSDEYSTTANTYTSNIFTVDTTPPVITVTYPQGETVHNTNVYPQERTATVTVKDRNFYAEGVTFEVEAQDAAGADVTSYDAPKLNVKEWNSKWTGSDGDNDGIVETWTAEVVFNADANYTVKAKAEDLAGGGSDEVNQSFTVDKTAPSEATITYKGYIKVDGEAEVLAEDLEGDTYTEEGNPVNYFNKWVVATLKAKDATSGLERFKVTAKATDSEGATDVELPKDLQIIADGNSYSLEGSIGGFELLESFSNKGGVMTVELKIPAQYRGNLDFVAVDRAHNETVGDDNYTVVTDTIAPGRTVKLDPTKMYNARDLSDFEGPLAEDSEVILYYNKDAVVTVDVEEANFYAGDVEFNVTKDGKEQAVEVKWDYLYDDQEKRVLDGYRGTFTLVDEGDYVVGISYKDRSRNEMVTYTSQRIVIDKKAPEITVKYGNKPEDAINILKDKDGNDRQYFSEDQTAVITIKEKNFRADDVEILVKATDLLGENVEVGTLTFNDSGNVKEYLLVGETAQETSALRRAAWANATYEENWRRQGDCYELHLTFSENANYTFDISYKDLAANAPAEDYAPDCFTVDKVLPETVNIEYSTNLFQNVLHDITFGYYNAKMTVTLTAKDTISGVNEFIYSYIKGDGVSAVNAELINEALDSAKITQIQNSYEYRTSFEIPKLALGGDNQFNGTVEFVAVDRCGNTSLKREDKNRVIVVDNIAPTATISYNAPVKQLGNVSYYAGNINATIVIDEANFYSEDVVVTVNDRPVTVSWSDDSADVHTGSFTLSSDGDYVVKVSYADRSTNAMTPYTSNQLTIDTKAPVIQVSDVKHESANNAETISFTVQVTDRNIALESFKPTLSVLRKMDNGNNQYSFTTEAINLGQPKTSVNGSGDTVYTYTVENLEVDGFYSLVCEAVDHANHTVSSINSTNNADVNTTVETVNFSVNREGSVFWITTEHTEGDEKIIDQLHDKYVNGEVTVRIHEINVDKVDDGKATIFTLNDGSSAEDIILDETNYKKNVSIGAGGWYQTDYTLDNSYFVKDGVYSINIITYDKATNSNVNTKSEEGTISFTVDRTKPVISANLTSRQIIDDTQYKVYFQITELNLDAETVVVKYNGETVALENLGNNEYSFTVREGLNQSVKISAVDLAGNESELFEAAPFTVSTNIFVRWYATGFWFWFPIIAIPLLIGLVILVIVMKKKKKEER